MSVSAHEVSHLRNIVLAVEGDRQCFLQTLDFVVKIVTLALLVVDVILVLAVHLLYEAAEVGSIVD